MRTSGDSARNLVIANGATLAGQNATIGSSIFQNNGYGRTLTNNGLMSADVNGGSWTVEPDTFVNSSTGIAQATNGGYLELYAVSGSNAGTLQGTMGGELVFYNASVSGSGELAATGGGAGVLDDYSSVSAGNVMVCLGRILINVIAVTVSVSEKLKTSAS